MPTQISQMAMCNRLDPIEQRLARWLLISRDQVPSDEVHMTQTSLAHVLGVRREAEAERAIADLSAKGVWRAPIVTELAPLEKFYPAEACHQDYFEQNPRQR